MQATQVTNQNQSNNPSRPAVRFLDAELLVINQAATELGEKVKNANPELRKKIEEIAKQTKINGYKSELEIEEFVGGSFRVIIKLNSEKKDSAPSIDEINKLLATGFNFHQEQFENLRKEGWLSRTPMSAILNPETKELSVDFRCFGGAKTKDPVLLDSLFSDPVSTVGRKNLWQSITANISRLAVLGDDAAEPELRNETERSLNGLRTLYRAIPEKEMVSLVNALLVANRPTVVSIREYLDSDRVPKDLLEKLPKGLKDAVEGIDQLTRNVPDKKYVDKIIEDNKETKLSDHLNMLLTLEHRSGAYSSRVIDVAEFELREAVRFAKSKAGNKQLSPEQAGEVVREYFEEHFKNEYNFRDSTPGIAGGIVVRRTDCSTRALIAREMFLALGYKCGMEYIISQVDGRPEGGQMAHIFNFLNKADGQKIFFDFGRQKDEPYSFNSDEPVVEHYRGGNQSIKIKKEVLTEDPAIFGKLINEPITDEISSVLNLLEKVELNLPDLVLKFPDKIAAVRKITGYLRVQEQLSKTGTIKLWEKGDRKELLEFYRTSK